MARQITSTLQCFDGPCGKVVELQEMVESKNDTQIVYKSSKGMGYVVAQWQSARLKTESRGFDSGREQGLFSAIVTNVSLKQVPQGDAAQLFPLKKLIPSCAVGAKKDQ